MISKLWARAARDRQRFILLAMALVVLLLCGCIKTSEETAQLSVTGIDMTASKVRSSNVDFILTIYVRNYDSASTENTSLLLKVYDRRTDLLLEKVRIPIGSIGALRTIEILHNITLPRVGSYEIRVNAYEGERDMGGSYKRISNLEALLPEVKESGLAVAEMDILVRNASVGRVAIQTDIYFTNEASDPSSSYDVLVKARERDAGLLADKRWMKLEPIQPEKTIIASTNLTVPEGYNYLVEAMIWSNSTLVKTAQGLVQLREDLRLSDQERIVSRSVDAGAFTVEETAAAAEEAPAGYGRAEGVKGMPGPGALAGFFGLILGAALRRFAYGRG
ncbi:MAG: hypothetical protein JW986_10470 [Methanotrichaceae archaeon]|nr:hypothetical protein [Methanotrichaceae archaeon]